MTNKYNNVYVENTSTIAGVTEGEGPLKKYFTYLCKDNYEEEKTFELAEANMLQRSVNNSIKDTKPELFLSGDLLNQLMPSNLVAKKLGVPYLGMYSACATSVESLIVASNFIDSGKFKSVLCSNSSHNCTAEKQFRYPNEYGGPKPIYSTHTSTGATSIILSNKKSPIKITSSTIGRVIDMGITDAFNMGAVMAPAAADTIYNHLTNLRQKPDYYDLILTGDLGIYGKEMLIDYMNKEYNLDIKKNYNDCGVMLYDLKTQQVNAGGSGPVCAPLVVYSYVMNKLKSGELKKVLICATGSLHSTTLVNQKISLPSIAHAISLETV